MLRHVIEFTERKPVQALRRRMRKRQRQFEERYLESFVQMRARDRGVEA